MHWIKKVVPMLIVQWCVWTCIYLIAGIEGWMLLAALGGAAIGTTLAVGLGMLFEEKVEE